MGSNWYILVKFSEKKNTIYCLRAVTLHSSLSHSHIFTVLSWSMHFHPPWVLGFPAVRLCYSWWPRYPVLRAPASYSGHPKAYYNVFTVRMQVWWEYVWQNTAMSLLITHCFWLKAKRRGKGSHVVLYSIVRYKFSIEIDFLLQQLCTRHIVENSYEIKDGGTQVLAFIILFNNNNIYIYIHMHINLLYILYYGLLKKIQINVWCCNKIYYP